MRIAIDLMGGDWPPEAILEATEEATKLAPLVGIADRAYLPRLCGASLELIPSEESIAMGDSPLYAVRRKKNSSMAVGMRLLRSGEITAFVSTGNTGALVATAAFHLPMLPTIDRPALLVLLPTEKGPVAVLDVGANVSMKTHHYVDYARLGRAFINLVQGIEEPKVGLLNIGEEDAKGSKLAREAYVALEENLPSDTFLGNIEGREVFHGRVDVLVTDGFTGNVFLKTCEGASAFLIDYLQEHFSSQTFPFLDQVHKRFNYAQHPGALLAGVEGIVIKCHGYSNKQALITGIQGAADLVQKNLTQSLKLMFS